MYLGSVKRKGNLTKQQVMPPFESILQHFQMYIYTTITHIASASSVLDLEAVFALHGSSATWLLLNARVITIFPETQILLTTQRSCQEINKDIKCTCLAPATVYCLFGWDKQNIVKIQCSTEYTLNA